MRLVYKIHVKPDGTECRRQRVEERLLNVQYPDHSERWAEQFCPACTWTHAYKVANIAGPTGAVVYAEDAPT